MPYVKLLDRPERIKPGQYVFRVDDVDHKTPAKLISWREGAFLIIPDDSHRSTWVDNDEVVIYVE